MAVPNTFSSGILAMSSDVNENFEAIDNVSQYGLTAGARQRGRIVLPDEIPCCNVAARANSTAVVMTNVYSIGARCYMVIKDGTTAGSAPTATKSNYIVDGTAVIAYIGYLAPVAYANSTALLLDQLFVANSRVYRVTTAGTTSGSGTGPSGVAAGTDGTVSYAYVSEQTLPVVSHSSTDTAPVGTTAQLAWNTANVTALGGTLVQIGANARGALFSVSTDGSAYTTGSIGGGTFATVSDAPSWSFRYYNKLYGLVFCDNQLLAYVENTSAAFRHIIFDSSGIIRKPRSFKIMVDSQTQFTEAFATAADTFVSYKPKNSAKAVLIGDSFAAYPPLGYAYRLGLALGYEDFRVSGLGGTGVLRTNGSNVNYGSRFSVDVIDHAPDVVFIQMTQNDQTGVPGSWSTTTLKNATGALIARVQNELPAAQVVLLSPWNNRGTVTGTVATMVTDGAALAVQYGIPYIDWSNYLTDGGFAGTLSGTGNSGIMTSGDGTHPSYHGNILRAGRLDPDISQYLDGTA